MTAPFVREWGTGQPIVAMAPLGLESSAFEAFGTALAARGYRTIAVDLPGFGRTPAPAGPLTPRVLAEPVLEMVRSLAVPPIVLGVSLGGRVALEVAAVAPGAVRAVVPIAPYLPWLRGRFLFAGARLIDPAIAAWLPLERLWPVLRVLADGFASLPYLRDDTLAQAGARLVYYLSCPATRESMLSAARELALDPADGPESIWARMAALDVPVAFVWGERDWLVSRRFARAVARSCPASKQVSLPCLGHWLNGPHHRCLAATIVALVPQLLDETGAQRAGRGVDSARLLRRPCVVDAPPEMKALAADAGASRA